MSRSSPSTPESKLSQPARRSRRSFRQTLVVLDPWIAIAAAIPWLFAEYALRTGGDFHPRTMMDDNDWSLFAWCWRIAVGDWLFFMQLAGSIILMAIACAPSRFRRWIYWIYLPTFVVGYALSWAAWAYLETKFQGVWRCCLPYADVQASSIMLALLISNPAATILLIRLVTPNVKFAGPKDKA